MESTCMGVACDTNGDEVNGLFDILVGVRGGAGAAAGVGAGGTARRGPESMDAKLAEDFADECEAGDSDVRGPAPDMSSGICAGAGAAAVANACGTAERGPESMAAKLAEECADECADECDAAGHGGVR